MFCQHLIPPVPLAMCLRPDNGGWRMVADCWNAPQWNQLLHVDCVHHGTFERAGLIQSGIAGTPLRRSYPFDCLYFWVLSFSLVCLWLPHPHCKSVCSTFVTLVTLISLVWLKRRRWPIEATYYALVRRRREDNKNDSSATTETWRRLLWCATIKDSEERLSDTADWLNFTTSKAKKLNTLK